MTMHARMQYEMYTSSTYIYSIDDHNNCTLFIHRFVVVIVIWTTDHAQINKYKYICLVQQLVATMTCDEKIAGAVGEEY